MAEQCSGEKHLKDQDLFCNQCVVRVCSKCLKLHASHSDKIIDIDSIVAESLNNVDNILKFIEDNNERKTIIDETFKINVEEDYRDELTNITNYFKKLHDKLHFKEQDLKRILKESRESNTEIYLYMKLLMEKNISESQHILQVLEASKDDNDMVIKKFNEFKLLELESSKKVSSTPFIPYKFKQVPTSEFDTIMSKNVLKAANALHENREQFVYWYYGDELKKFNMKTREVTMVDAQEMETPPNSIWSSMVSTRTHLYIFNNTSYWMYDPLTTVWTKKAIPEAVNLGGYVPAFYDGKAHIYLFGGYEGGTFHLDVARFNIENERFEFKFAKLNASHQNDPLIIDGDENLIYLVGGYHHKDTDTLDVLDVSRKTVTTLRHFTADGFPNLTTGVYVPATNSIYMITREYLFFRYEITEKKCYPLANPKGNGYYNRLFFDGDNTMFLTSTKLDSLLEYNINTNTWETTMNFAPSSAYGLCMGSF